MAFSCISHIFANLTTPTPRMRNPTPTHTGLIHQASLPRNPPSTFPPAPNAPTTAFAPSLVSGAEYRAQCKVLLSRPRTPERTEAARKEGRGEDGTSWVSGVKDVDGWDVGWERATQMFVKRKGRGRFGFEEAMVEGWGVGLGEVADGDGDVDRAERLEDGFGFRCWMEEEKMRGSGNGQEEVKEKRLNRREVAVEE